MSFVVLQIISFLATVLAFTFILAAVHNFVRFKGALSQIILCFVVFCILLALRINFW
jgi:hypothetical protein